MSYESFELSTEDGNPIELYLFTYSGTNYLYTSSQYYQENIIGGVRYIFNPEYIKRGDSLKLGDSGGSVETCTVEVLRTNPIALLYQGAPPELSSIRLQVFRVHGEKSNESIKILDGVVSQVRFRDSYAELTITIENMLNRFIPRGTLSYNCQNCIYDEKCNLDRNNYGVLCFTTGGIQNLTIFSSNLLQYPTDYFTDGFITMGNSVRAVVKHDNNYVRLKYPINKSEERDRFMVYPGCSNLFTKCAEKFNNTDNFNGIPYIQPYDAFKHPVGTGGYWVDGNIVYRDTFGNIKVPGV